MMPMSVYQLNVFKGDTEALLIGKDLFIFLKTHTTKEDNTFFTQFLFPLAKKEHFKLMKALQKHDSECCRFVLNSLYH